MQQQQATQTIDPPTRQVSVPSAVIIIGHGSLRSASGASMIRIAARLRAEGITGRSNIQVEPAFLNFSRPTLVDALARCAEHGVEQVTIQPYFLIAGSYVRNDLPQVVEQALARFPQMHVEIAPAFGHHPALVDLARQRICEAAPELARAEGWGLLLMAHGTPIAVANAPLYATLRDLQETLGIEHGRVAFLDCNAPDIPTGVDQLAQAGAQQLVTLPYFLHMGRHVREDLPGLIAQARAARPRLPIVEARHLDYDLRLVDVIRDRLLES